MSGPRDDGTSKYIAGSFSYALIIGEKAYASLLKLYAQDLGRDEAACEIRRHSLGAYPFRLEYQPWLSYGIYGDSPCMCLATVSASTLTWPVASFSWRTSFADSCSCLSLPRHGLCGVQRAWAQCCQSPSGSQPTPSQPEPRGCICVKWTGHVFAIRCLPFRTFTMAVMVDSAPVSEQRETLKSGPASLRHLTFPVREVYDGHISHFLFEHFCDWRFESLSNNKQDMTDIKGFIFALDNSPRGFPDCS